MKTNFYDIESLENVFTLCNFRPEEKRADVFYLVDTPTLLSDPDFDTNLKAVIRKANKNLDDYGIEDKDIYLFDLRFELGNKILAQTFGLSDAYLVNDPNSKSSFPAEFRLVCDTDPKYTDEDYPYFFGYNSYNYDTTMYAEYMYETFSDFFKPQKNMHPNTAANYKTAASGKKFTPTTAYKMRQYNDELFSPKFKEYMYKRLLTTYDEKHRLWTKDDYNATPFRIRQNMLMSGRHLDVARLNEKQLKVGLKRLLGMLGYQILESDKLGKKSRIDTAEELYDLIAYNMSDCINLHKLFMHPFYQGQFTLKRGLLTTYPELIYNQKEGEYKPDISPDKVNRQRLCIDTSSAQFATKALCPYGHLKDMPTVSFMYPSENKAKELGIKRVNVLEEARDFFYRNFPQPDLRARFDKVYYYYKSIEGKNFNESSNYLEDYGNPGIGLPENLAPHSLSKIPKADTCLPYFLKDGTASSCFALFSTGGVHGAEYNLELFEYDHLKWEFDMADMNYAKSVYPNPVDLHNAKEITMPDGRVLPSKTFIKSGATKTKALYKEWEKNEPVLFAEKDDGSTSLNSSYTWTSADPTNHEDFTSYYPNMLRMMEAFYNPGLGYDRYAEIFDNKQKYGKLMKDKSLPQADRDLYSVLREGTKLILNSASGAGDVAYETNIRMNNTIISMRIIGQLFTWRIAQAQTIAGAKITSTNTDGLYSVLDPEINNPLLAKESADIGVEIEPEPTYLVSKDSNNRFEMDPDTGKIESASGGTLGCRKGPSPTKALAHPALIDWALTEYLVVAALKAKPTLGLTLPFDAETGMNILNHAIKNADDKEKKIKFLLLAQNVIASSVGTITYNFGLNDNGEIVIMQHYNRIFLVKPDIPNSLRIKSAIAKAITPAMKAKRIKDGERPQQHDQTALQILSANGVSMSDIPSDKEASIKKVVNIEEDWRVIIENRDLYHLDESEIDNLIASLNLDNYLSLLSDAFTNNWMNKIPSEKIPPHLMPPEPKPKKTKNKKSDNSDASELSSEEDVKAEVNETTAEIVASETDNTPTTEVESVDTLELDGSMFAPVVNTPESDTESVSDDSNEHKDESGDDENINKPIEKPCHTCVHRSKEQFEEPCCFCKYGTIGMTSSEYEPAPDKDEIISDLQDRLHNANREVNQYSQYLRRIENAIKNLDSSKDAALEEIRNTIEQYKDFEERSYLD